MRRMMSIVVVTIATFVIVGVNVERVAADGFVVGGWDTARGGQASIRHGSDFALVRDSLATVFPDVVMSDSPILTPAYLGGVDAVLLDAVYAGYGVPIAALSPTEKQALSDFVRSGGNALIVTDNSDFHSGGNSLLESFGLQQSATARVNPALATVTNPKTSDDSVPVEPRARRTRGVA